MSVAKNIVILVSPVAAGGINIVNFIVWDLKVIYMFKRYRLINKNWPKVFNYYNIYNWTSHIVLWMETYQDYV